MPAQVDRQEVVPVLRPDLVDGRLDRARCVPAQFTRTSMRPKVSTALRDHGLDLRLVPDVGGDDERPPPERPRLGGHRLQRRGRSRAARTRSAPSPARRSEIARPMPFAAPVTIAVWPASLMRSPRAGRGPGAREPSGRVAVAAAPARVDHDDVARPETHGLLPLDVARGPVPLERDAVGGAGLAAERAPRRDDPALEHGRERRVRENPVRAREAASAPMRAGTAAPRPERVAEDLDRVLGLDDLDRRVHDVGHVDPHGVAAVPRGAGAFPAPVDLVEDPPPPVLAAAEDEHALPWWDRRR